MSRNGSDDSDGRDDDSDSGLADIPARDSKALHRALREMEKENRKRNQEVANLMKQLEDSKKAKKERVGEKRKVTKIKDIAPANLLPFDKQISLHNYLRDVVFRGLKLVTKEVLDAGVTVARAMTHLQFITDYDKRMYRTQIELTIQKQIGQYRDNTIKNIKWKYKTNRGTGPGKSIYEGRNGWQLFSLTVLYVQFPRILT
jgi:hypothetical protein